MARDRDDQPGNLWDAAEWAKARSEALTASGAIDRHPAALIDNAVGATRAREALSILRAHEPYKPSRRPLRASLRERERYEAAG